MAPVHLQTKTESRGRPVVDPPEEAVIAEVGGAIAEATERREARLGDPRAAARRAAVEIASAMLDASSAETAAHSDDVDVITEGIGRTLGLSEQSLDDTLLAARLHDIGKLGVPTSIINKPGPLDSGEWQLMHRHTIIGEQILLAVPELRGVAHLVRHSHERWDGGGYPDGVAGEDIPLGSRIVFCADAYHAIRSDRPYRKGRSAAESLAEIRSCAGTQFDPAVVEALEAVAAEIRASSNGSRPRAVRPRRLMALMLIVSVGACGSAFARSGVMPEAQGSASTPAPGSSAPAAPLGSEVVVPTTQLDALNASRLSADSAVVSVGLLSALPPDLTIAPGPGLAPTTALPGLGGSEVGDDLVESETSPVRDHGQGVGQGKSQGKGRGAERGNKKPKEAKGEAGKDTSGNANGHAKASKPKSNAHAPSSHSSGKSSTAKTKSAGSEKTKSSEATTGKTASPPKPQKPEKVPVAPKPPKPEAPATPPAPELPSAAPTGVPGGPGGGAGNAGGNGRNGRNGQ